MKKNPFILINFALILMDLYVIIINVMDKRYLIGAMFLIPFFWLIALNIKYLRGGY